MYGKKMLWAMTPHSSPGRTPHVPHGAEPDTYAADGIWPIHHGRQGQGTQRSVKHTGQSICMGHVQLDGLDSPDNGSAKGAQTRSGDVGPAGRTLELVVPART